MGFLLYLFLLASLWSPSFLFIKIGLGGFPPLTLAASRVGIAATLLWIFLRLSGRTLPRSPSLWRRFLFMGLFGNAIPFALFCLGETRADSGPAAILNSTTPIFTVLLAHVFISDERLSGARIGGVLIGFAGILVMFFPSLQGGFLRSGTFWGYVAFTGAALCYGITNVYARRYLRDVPARVSATAQLISASILLWPVAVAIERPFAIRPGTGPLLAVLALAVIGTALAMTLFFDLMRKTSATFVSMVTYIIPPAGIALGAVFLHEHVGWNHLAGCYLILVGVMVVNGVLVRTVRRLVPGRRSAV